MLWLSPALFGHVRYKSRVLSYFPSFSEVTMPITFDNLPALARAAVPATSTVFSPELVLWNELVPGGCHWSGLLRRGNTLRLTDLSGTANVSALFFNQEE